MRNSKAGLVVLLIKLGPKLVPILTKLGDIFWNFAKSLVGIKSAGLVGSVGLYTYLFTWQMAVALIAFIGIHEYGHVWAMKKCGIKTKGMFFLPGIGAVAIAEERFGSAKNEAYIAIMGPLFGLLFFILPGMVMLWSTGNALWAAIVGIMTFVNLINLFPIHPLDGGRILKALAYSKRQVTSLIIIVTISIATAAMSVYAGFFLLLYMAMIGLIDITHEFGIGQHIQVFLRSMIRGGMAIVMILIAQELYEAFTAYRMDEVYESATLPLPITMLVMFTCIVIIILDIRSATLRKGISVFTYPIVVLADVWEGIKQLLKLRAYDVKAIQNYGQMDRNYKVWYASSFVTITLVHVMIIYVMGNMPGAELATELLK